MKKDHLLVLFCYLLWGVLPIFWKLLSAADPVWILANRLFWSLIFCWVIVCVTRQRAALHAVLRQPRQALYLLLCGVVITINWGFYISAISTGHVIESSIAYFMCPIFSVMLGFFFFREKLDFWQWAGVALALAGVLVPVIRYGQVPWYALIIGISFAVYGALKKRVTVDSNVSLFMETLPLAPFALAFMLWQQFSGGGTAPLAPWQIALVPLTGIVTSAPLLLFSKGIRGTPLSLSGILMYLNPVLQLLLGVLLYREEFTGTHALMLTFVLAAVLLFLWRQQRQVRQLVTSVSPQIQ